MNNAFIKNTIIPSIAGIISIFLAALAVNGMPAVLVRASEELGVSSEMLAKSGSFQFIGFFIATIAGAIIADYKGMKAVLTTGCLLSAVGAYIWALSPNVITAWAGGAVLGMGGGILEGMSSVLLAHLFVNRRKLALNLSQIFFCAGAVLGPWILGYTLPAGISWRWFFVGVGCVAILLAGLYLCSTLPQVEPEDRIDFSRFMGLMRSIQLWIPCVAIFLYVLAEASVIIYCNMYLQEFFAAPEQWAVRSIGLVWAAMGVGRFLCAFIPEKTSYEKTISALFVALGLSLCAQMLVQNWQLSIALFVAAGFFCSGIWPLIVGVTARAHAKYSATAIGLVVAVGALGAATAPPFMNTLLDILPTDTVYVGVAIIAFIGASVIMLFQHNSKVS